MDPFLEDPELWPDVHHELISVLRGQINARLRRRYVARIELRVYLAPEDDPSRTLIRIPDLRVEPGSRPEQRLSSALSVVAVSEPIELTTMHLDDETEEALIKVVEPATREVITVIEVLSPSNKVSGSEGRASYTKKRYEVLRSPAHLVEIDLLRAGKPTFPRGKVACDYALHVSRVERRPKGHVWPIYLRNRLPSVAIPLRGNDPDLVIDLQETLATAYDRAAYGDTLQYHGDPIPPLGPEDATWADELLRGAGLRSSR
jgi:hypothetical protein